MSRSGIVVAFVFGVTASARFAHAQSCPASYASCDDGACCPSADQCCPTMAEGCCGSYAPYCCGNGTCAVSPSACSADRTSSTGGGTTKGGAPACEGYDLPCGDGCAPAGADCCDPRGHYCPPGSVCASANTCVVGDASQLAAATTLPPPPPERVLSPLADPKDASARSCAVAAGAGTSPGPIALLAALPVLALRRHHRRRARRSATPASALAISLCLGSACGGPLRARVDRSAADAQTPLAEAGSTQAEAGAEASGEPEAASTDDGLDAPSPGPEAGDGSSGVGSDEDASAVDESGASSDGGTVDKWGIPQIHPTKAGGREWYLPDNADQPDPTHEWQPQTAALPIVKTPGSPPYFTTGGGDPCGQVRLDVTSPPGKPWWKNIEMTWYVRYQRQQGNGSAGSCGQANHWELHARGERHSSATCTPASLNYGVAAPPGTTTWPGYPFSGYPSISEHCLGTAYHGNYYSTGRYLFEKEISHIAGYATQEGDPGDRWTDATNQGKWIGMKWAIVTVAAGQAGQVDLELWLDENGTGAFKRAIRYSDTGPNWSAATIDSACGLAPFNYTTSMRMDWAGPWATFRSDDMVMDFKEASVREIDGL